MKPRCKRVIVIGFDGLEPSIVDRLMAAGRLPAFARLRALGGYSRLATTTPAQTPAAWSSFATGLNPGGHGIFDFLRRDPRTYLPDLGLARHEQRSALLPPSAVNLRSGTTVWERLGQAGIPSTIIRCPCTYPPDGFKGRLLAGVGVPDVRGGIGTSQVFSSAPLIARESEVAHRLEQEGGEWRALLVGPRHPGRREDLTMSLSLTIEASGAASLVLAGRTRVALPPGTWTDLVPVAFKAGPLTTIRGQVRFLLVATAPEVVLYASPIGFDPAAPAFPISHPWSYAGELARATGPYDALGMPEDHTGLSNGRFDEDQFLAQCELVLAEREAMLRHELHRTDRGLLYCLFDTPDRVQHMFWRFGVAGHPANRAHGAHARYADVIADHYVRCDRILAEVLGATDAETVVLALSDHGFTSFERGVHLNGWLVDRGWMSLTPGAVRGDGSFLAGVDWSRTRAYALGFGAIYLNVAGREGQGIVAPAERAALARQLAGELGGLVDPERQVVAITGAGVADDLYRGPRAAEAPDVVARFNHGYRASWETALGGMGTGLVEDNTRKWGGDHIVDPALVPGVLLSSHPDLRDGPAIADLAPTILELLGVTPGGMDGRSLLS